MPPPQEPSVPNRDLPGPRLEKGSSLLEAATSLAEGRRSMWLLVESPCVLELPHGAKPCSSRADEASRLGAPHPLPPGTPAGWWTWWWLQILSAPLNCRVTLGKLLDVPGSSTVTVTHRMPVRSHM